MNKKMWFLCTVRYYSATKKNEIMSFAGKWVEKELFKLMERSQSQKDKYHVFSPMWMPEVTECEFVSVPQTY
jgi:hypothetical protein